MEGRLEQLGSSFFHGQAIVHHQVKEPERFTIAISRLHVEQFFFARIELNSISFTPLEHMLLTLPQFRKNNVSCTFRPND